MARLKLTKRYWERYKLIDGYILQKYLKTFLLAMALIIVIVITFDVSEKLDDFLHNHAPLSKIVFQYYLNFIPGFINLYSPLFIFISVIFFTSKMAGNTEIIAILSSGLSYKRLLRPYLHGSIIVAIIVIVLSNFIIPWSNRYLMEFENTYFRTIKKNYFNSVHFQTDERTLVFADSYNTPSKSASRVCIDMLDNNKKIVRRIEADKITYDTIKHKWECTEYFVRTFDKSGEHLRYNHKVYAALGIEPEDFRLSAQQIETMNSLKLYSYIQHERLRGSAAVKPSLIEFWQRILNPLAVIVMTFIGVAVSSRKTRGGIGMHLAIGITIAFAFIVFMKITTVFAINGNLSPFWAVMMPQIVFGIAAVVLVKKAPK
ncbi:MAG: LptF/LptG family permease [Bacteroidales bacterium]|nr:LptF/LptG family permease [Bacteroidales bacterium]